MIITVAAMLPLLRRRLGVRVRSALAAAVVVAFASLLAGAALLVTAQAILTANVDTAAESRADRVVTALAGGADMERVLRPCPRERTVVQILDDVGTVVAASTALAGRPAISPLRPEDGGRARETRELGSEDFRVVAAGVGTPYGSRTVLVGESLDLVDDGSDAIVAAMLLGMPLLTVVVGAATFVFVGRTLRPVEAMRARAASITSRNLDARLPVPAADDEIAALAATMNTMLDRIESATATQRRFVADASHELRSPLATVRANVDLLAGAELDSAAARSVARIGRESARMSRLVEDLLLLARADDAGLRFRRSDVDLDDLVLTERERMALEHPALTVSGAVEPVRVQGDPDALLRALRNLVDNAARHALGAVTVSVHAGERAGEIVVANDGPPIPAADRVRIFDRFVRLDDSRSRAGGGAGLGLPIAREIVLAHGGTLTVDDLPVGASLRLRVPR
jgi:signal transduction histidine kinase